MADFFEKLKESVLAGATTIVNKSEEAARMGKCKLDIYNLEKNLEAKYSKLGKFSYKYNLEKNENPLQDSTEYLELLGEIQQNLQEISDKEEELKNISTVEKADNETTIADESSSKNSKNNQNVSSSDSDKTE